MATGNINEMVEELSLSVNDTIETHRDYGRERRTNWFYRKCKDLKKNTVKN